MGAVRRETGDKGYHEYESVSLSDPKCLSALIKYKAAIYPSDRSQEHFSELMTCIYVDLENLVKETTLTKGERWTVERLMDGYNMYDCADLSNSPYRTIQAWLRRACIKMAKHNSNRAMSVLRKRLDVKDL